MTARARDRLGSLVLLAFVLSLFAQRHYMTPFGGMFPDAVMVVLAAILIATLALSFTRHAAIKEVDAAKGTATPRRWKDMAVVGGILLAWAVVLRPLGFAVTSMGGFATISWYLSGRRHDRRVMARSLVVAAVVTGVLMLVFGRLLQVPLPAGTIFTSM